MGTFSSTPNPCIRFSFLPKNKRIFPTQKILFDKIKLNKESQKKKKLKEEREEHKKIFMAVIALWTNILLIIHKNYPPILQKRSDYLDWCCDHDLFV